MPDAITPAALTVHVLTIGGRRARPVDLQQLDVLEVDELDAAARIRLPGTHGGYMCIIGTDADGNAALALAPAPVTLQQLRVADIGMPHCRLCDRWSSWARQEDADKFGEAVEQAAELKRLPVGLIDLSGEQQGALAGDEAPGE